MEQRNTAMDDTKNVVDKNEPPPGEALITSKEATDNNDHHPSLSDADDAKNQSPSNFVFYEPHEKSEPRLSGPSDKIIPHKFDILCGRDKVCHNHVGNHRFRVIIEMYRVPYQTAPTKDDKMRITKEIVTTVTSNGFRFLKKVGGSADNSEEWAELDEAMARDKVSHALRGAKDPHQHQPRRKTNATNRRKSSMDSTATATTAVTTNTTTTATITTTSLPVTDRPPLSAPSEAPEDFATRRTKTKDSAVRRKRSASSDSASSTSSSGSECTSTGTSADSPGAAKTPKLSNLPKSQQRHDHQQLPPPLPLEVLLSPTDLMSIESITQSLQNQASLNIDDEPLPFNPLSSSRPSFDSLSRHERYLEISRRQNEVLQDASTETFRRSSMEPLAAARLPPPSPNDRLSQPTAPLGAAPRLPRPQEEQPLIMPIGVISTDDDDNDEDEPPTIAELMNDKLLREALLGSVRQPKITTGDGGDDDTGTPMLESLRSVQTLMSTYSQQQQMDSVRSVDSIMSSFASKFSPFRNDLEPLPFQSDQDDGDASEPLPDSTRSVEGIMSLVSKSQTEYLPFQSTIEGSLEENDSSRPASDSVRSVDILMALVAKSSPGLNDDTEPLPVHGEGAIHEGNDDDEDEPPTIADLMNDNMLCEALLGSLRLDTLKSSQDDIMSSAEKMPSP